MMDGLSWLPIAAPLTAALLLSLVGREERATQRAVALLGAGVALLMACAAWWSFDPAQGGYRFETNLAGLERSALEEFGIVLRLGIDGTSLPLLLMSGVVGLCAVLATDPEIARPREHYALLLVGIAACNGAFLSINLFFFFFFCELATLPKFLLVARWWRAGANQLEPRPSAVAMQMTVYMLLGAMAFLAVMVLLASSLSGSLDFDRLGEASEALDPAWQATLYGILIFALGTWSGLWPLHAWAPAAYATAQAPANMVFAAVSKTFGLYGLLRLGSSVLPAGAETWSGVLFVLGMVNVLYAAWVTMRQKDWNRLIAYASISHAGYTFIALSAGTELARTAAVVLMFAHGLVTALGFLLADELSRATGRSRVGELGGLARALPTLSLAFAVFAIAGAGFPGSATFVAELMVFFSVWEVLTPMAQTAAVVCVFGVILSATYLFRALHDTFFGPPSETMKLRPGAERFRPATLLAATLLVVASTAVGVWPRLITDLLASGEWVTASAEVVR